MNRYIRCLFLFSMFQFLSFWLAGSTSSTESLWRCGREDCTWTTRPTWLPWRESRPRVSWSDHLITITSSLIIVHLTYRNRIPVDYTNCTVFQKCLGNSSLIGTVPLISLPDCRAHALAGQSDDRPLRSLQVRQPESGGCGRGGQQGPSRAHLHDRWVLLTDWAWAKKLMKLTIVQCDCQFWALKLGIPEVFIQILDVQTQMFDSEFEGRKEKNLKVTIYCQYSQ